MNPLAIIRKLWLSFNNYFDKNSHGIWGLPTILKVTLIVFFVFFGSFFTNLIDLSAENATTSLYARILFLVITGLLLTWLIFIPILSIQLLWRLLKNTLDMAKDIQTKIKNIDDKKLKESLQFLFVNYKIRFDLKYAKYKNLIIFYTQNFFDPLPEEKKNETTDQYLKRIDAKYALRYTKFVRTQWFLQAYRAYWADFDQYEPKSRKMLKQFAKEIMKTADYWDQKYRDASWRYYEEVGKYK